MRKEINGLNDPNKIARRRSLEKIEKETINKGTQISKETLKEIFDEVYKGVLKLFNDPVDRTRESALSCLLYTSPSPRDS